MNERLLFFLLRVLLGLAFFAGSSHGDTVDVPRLASAIERAENSPVHPYGILVTYKATSPRRACLNTIRHALARWRASGAQGDPIEFIARSYAPIGARNDPNGLNRYWAHNVRWFYQHPKA